MSGSPEEMVAAIREAVTLPKFSPSAPFDLRRIALEKVDAQNPTREPVNRFTGWRPRWWEQYPEGQHAAAIFRIWRVLGIEFWEVKDEELPR